MYKIYQISQILDISFIWLKFIFSLKSDEISRFYKQLIIMSKIENDDDFKRYDAGTLDDQNEGGAA